MNPYVYAPVSVPGGLGGPADGSFNTGTSGSYQSRVEVYDTCDYDDSKWPTVDNYCYFFYVRLIDRCGKCYVFKLSTRPTSDTPMPFSFALDDGSSVTGNLYTDGHTTLGIGYVDGTNAHFVTEPLYHGKWSTSAGATTVSDPEGNQTDTSYNNPDNGQQYDEVTTPTGDAWRYYHDTGDSKIRKIQQVAQGSSSVEIAYDGQNPSQVAVKDGSGQVRSQTDYTWVNGRISTALKGNRKRTYEYTENGEVITVSDMDQSQATITETVYDYRTAGSTIVTEKHLTGPGQDRTTTFSFYTSGDKKTYVHTVTDSDGKVTTYDVNTTTGRVNSIQDSTGLTTSYLYNDKNALTTTTYSKSGMTTYHEHNDYYKDTSGLDTVWLKSHETIHPSDDSARGNLTYYIRNDSTKLWRLNAVKSDPVGARAPAPEQWDTFWAVIPESRLYDYYVYGDSDGLPGQLKTQTTPDVDGEEDYVVSYRYTEAGKRRWDPVQTTYKYWNGTYGTRDSYASYNDMGDLLTTTDANSRVIQYEYDVLGRPRKAIFGTGIESESQYSCCTMDWSKDEDGRKTYYAYDDMNRAIKVWSDIQNPTGEYPLPANTPALVEYAYDAFSNVTDVITRSDANTTRTTHYTYDTSNRVTRIDYPAPLGHEEFGYDSAGSLWWARDGNNAVTLYRYDDLYRLTDVYYNYGGILPPNPGWAYPENANVHYAYYGATGLVQTMTDSAGQSSYVYNGRDQLTTYIPPQPANRTISYEYNNLGQKKRMNATGLDVRYNYFANGWLKDVRRNSETGTLVASYAYNPVGLRTGVTFGNSTWQTFNYEDVDPRYRLDNIHYGYNCGSGITDQGGLTFTRDKTGNPLHWGDLDGVYTRVCGYDENSRLKSANLPGSASVTYDYDWVGNRQNPGGMEYNAADQLTSWPGQRLYEYYGDGSLRFQKDAAGIIQKTHSYTPDGLLSSVAHAGAGTSSMTWNDDGDRITFTSSTDQSNPYTFVYDLIAGVPAVIEEVHNGVSVLYIRAPGGALIARLVGSDTQFYHFDNMGSTLFLTGADGTVSDKYTYDAWGNATHTGNTQQPYQYVGRVGYYSHYQDNNLPLLQLGLRQYDPVVGRFTQVDPLGDGLNWYAYVGNMPTAAADPWGLVPSQYEADNSPGSMGDDDHDGVPNNIEWAEGTAPFRGTGGGGSGGTSFSGGGLTSGLRAAAGRVWGSIKGALSPSRCNQPAPCAHGTGPAAKTAPKTGNTPACQRGNARHNELKAKVNAKPGWAYESRIKDPRTGKWKKPDVTTPSGNRMSYKPKTPTGIKKGKQDVRDYQRITGRRARIIYYCE